MKVLIVEDDEDRGCDLKKYLESKSIDVLWAKDGFEALLLLQSYKDVKQIFTDVNMIGMGGFELAGKLKENEDQYIREIPLFMYSSRPIPDYALELAMEYGVNKFLDSREVNMIGEEALSLIKI